MTDAAQLRHQNTSLTFTLTWKVGKKNQIFCLFVCFHQAGPSISSLLLFYGEEKGDAKPPADGCRLSSGTQLLSETPRASPCAFPCFKLRKYESSYERSYDTSQNEDYICAAAWCIGGGKSHSIFTPLTCWYICLDCDFVTNHSVADSFVAGITSDQLHSQICILREQEKQHFR